MDTTKYSGYKARVYNLSRLALAESGAHNSVGSSRRLRPCLRPPRPFLRKADRLTRLAFGCGSPAANRTAMMWTHAGTLQLQDPSCT